MSPNCSYNRLIVTSAVLHNFMLSEDILLDYYIAEDVIWDLEKESKKTVNPSDDQQSQNILAYMLETR